MDFSRYEELSRKVTQKFSEIQARRPADFACRPGCHSCCVPEITVVAVEREYIRKFLLDNAERLARVQSLAAQNPFQGERCAFLEADGKCSIYEVRPLVCRSHGAPLVARLKNDDLTLDACPLNFTETDLAEISNQDTIQLDTLNALLSLVNRAAFAERSEDRYPLTPEGIIGNSSR